MKVMLVFDAVILLFGIYMVISSLQMKKSGRINAMVIAEEEMKKCKEGEQDKQQQQPASVS